MYKKTFLIWFGLFLKLHAIIKRICICIYSWSALHFSSQNGHPAVVELLLEAGGEVEAGVPDGDTPLILAAQNGHVSVVNILLDKGAKINHTRQDGCV